MVTLFTGAVFFFTLATRVVQKRGNKESLDKLRKEVEEREIILKRYR